MPTMNFYDEQNYLEDEGIDNDDDDDENEQIVYYSDDETLKLFPNLNTPVTTTQIMSDGMYLELGATKRRMPELTETNLRNDITLDSYLNEMKRERALKPAMKPAILASLGTTSSAKMAERPKPSKKAKTSLVPRSAKKKESKHRNTPNDNVDSNEDDQELDEFENEVRQDQ